MKSEELEGIKRQLLMKRRTLVGDIAALEGEALKKSRQDASGDLSNMPIHMADIGSDNFEQELMVGLMENDEGALRDIDDALDKIERGVFGHCESCSTKIGSARIRAIPYARLCIECKRLEEEGEGESQYQ